MQQFIIEIWTAVDRERELLLAERIFCTYEALNFLSNIQKKVVNLFPLLQKFSLDKPKASNFIIELIWQCFSSMRNLQPEFPLFFCPIVWDMCFCCSHKAEATQHNTTRHETRESVRDGGNWIGNCNVAFQISIYRQLFRLFTLIYLRCCLCGFRIVLGFCELSASALIH